MAIVAQELGKDPAEFSKKEYLTWLAETLGINVARMHNSGWFHGYLTTHNITLDGRITDLDSVGWLDKVNVTIDKAKEDVNDSASSLDGFLRRSGLIREFNDPGVFTKLVFDSYNKEIQNKKFKLIAN